jgi:hypothetical protein
MCKKTCRPKITEKDTEQCVNINVSYLTGSRLQLYNMDLLREALWHFWLKDHGLFKLQFQIHW